MLLSGCASDIRHDLLVDSYSTHYGNLIVHFQEVDRSAHIPEQPIKYNILLRLEDIPKEVNSSSIYFKSSLFYDSNQTNLVFDGKRMGGKIDRRDRYHDWIVGRYLDVDLNFQKYSLIITINSEPIDSEALKIELSVTPKEVEMNNGLLDLF